MRMIREERVPATHGLKLLNMPTDSRLLSVKSDDAVLNTITLSFLVDPENTTVVVGEYYFAIAEEPCPDWLEEGFFLDHVTVRTPQGHCTFHVFVRPLGDG